MSPVKAVAATGLLGIRAIKVSIPRPAVSGDPDDTDVFGGQFHGSLVRLTLDVPARPASPGAT